MSRTLVSPSAPKKHWQGQHRFEHWYRDNQCYFITAKARNSRPVFDDDGAKDVFWDRFEHWTDQFGFTPFVTSLLDNHYHTLGYLRVGANLGPMMQRLHGSVAKLVNDTLDRRHQPFWKDKGGRDYFDGCIRDEKQCRRAYRYTLIQSERHGLARDWRGYRHTKVVVDLEPAVWRCKRLGAFLEGVRYKRYDDRRRHAR
ncbi:MAG: hypothetical protein AAF656_13040 [Planctomycetota bacterium]